MRTFLAILCASAMAWAGCSGPRGGAASFSEVPAGNQRSPVLPSREVIMTPDTMLVGKVSRANQEGRFVVMTFPIGHLPAFEQRLSVYRRGLKVGEVRVTGPQLDDNVVADIAVGEAQPGDEVRAQ